MKKVLSLLFLMLFSLASFSQLETIKTTEQDPVEICKAIYEKMNAEFQAYTIKTVNGDYAVSMFDRKEKVFEVNYRVVFEVYKGYFDYDIEYIVNSEIDPYDFDETEAMYYIIRQDLLYIQSVVQSIKWS